MFPDADPLTGEENNKQDARLWENGKRDCSF